jgi:hypothetical protein
METKEKVNRFGQGKGINVPSKMGQVAMYETITKGTRDNSERRNKKGNEEAPIPLIGIGDTPVASLFLFTMDLIF